MTPAHTFNCFTMCLEDAAPVCECCRKQVEVSARVRFQFLPLRARAARLYAGHF